MAVVTAPEAMAVAVQVRLMNGHYTELFFNSVEDIEDFVEDVTRRTFAGDTSHGYAAITGVRPFLWGAN